MTGGAAPAVADRAGRRIRVAPAEAGEGLLLAGDVGGTKTVLALVTPRGEIVAEAAYPSRDFAGLPDVVRAFRERHPAAVRRVALSVAGPVVDGRVRITNLAWELEEARGWRWTTTSSSP